MEKLWIILGSDIQRAIKFSRDIVKLFEKNDESYRPAGECLVFDKDKNAIRIRPISRYKDLRGARRGARPNAIYVDEIYAKNNPMTMDEILGRFEYAEIEMFSLERGEACRYSDELYLSF